MIKNVSLDARYKTSQICKEIIDQGQTPLMPYTIPRTKDGYFKKYEYVYDELYNFYICPNIKTMYYTITSKTGYREYLSDPKDCKKCTFKDQCTKSKQKKICRHVWEDYVEQTDEIRYTQIWKDLYPKRKETIERVFADVKEKFDMRYTRLKGLKKIGTMELVKFLMYHYFFIK